MTRSLEEWTERASGEHPRIQVVVKASELQELLAVVASWKSFLEYVSTVGSTHLVKHAAAQLALMPAGKVTS